MSTETGKIIKARLKQMGKTQRWLAENIKTPDKEDGLSINAVSKWTKTGQISRVYIQQVADLLGITTDQLLGGEPLMELIPPEETTIERLNAEEKELLDLYRGTGKESRQIIMSTARITPKLPARAVRRPN